MDLKWISAILKRLWKTYITLSSDTGTNDFIFDFEIICRTGDKLDVTKRNVCAAAVF